MILSDGEEITAFGPSAYRPYAPGERAALAASLGAWEAPEALSEMIETVHARLMAPLVNGDPRPEIAGFHGQTLAHEPGGRGTFQAGDGGVLAEVLGLPVVWDFRSADVEMGGQGAPLAPFFHHALARYIGATGPVGFLNLGGVGNLTWVDPRIAKPDGEGALLAFDTGPANAPINDLMQARAGQAFDEEGKTAARGRVAEGVIEAFLREPFFFRMPPKSLDRDAWGALVAAVAPLSTEDAAATLTAAAAAAVAAAMEHCPAPPERIFVSGGGRRNPVLMAMIKAGVEAEVLAVEEVGLDGDMLEAQAFAFLALRVARGLPTSAPGTTGVAAPIGGGKISYPTATPAPIDAPARRA